MNIAAFFIGVLGFLFGLMNIYYEMNGFHGQDVYGFPIPTLIVAIIGLIGAILVLFKKRFGAWLCLFATVAGVFSAFMLWEAAGSFFLASSLLGLGIKKRTVNQSHAE